MSSEHHAFDARWWENHYQQNPAYREHPAKHRSPSPQLVAEVSGLPAGTALDAGCGQGVDALWLAQRGWRVTAVDVSPTAVNTARELAAGNPVDGAVDWIVADLATWQPPERYDLVVSQYVHPTIPFGDFVTRLAEAVAPGGTLLVVGHDHADEHSKATAPEKASIGPEAVTKALDPHDWDIEVAEARARHTGHGRKMHDLVVRARRAGPPAPDGG
jgi:2-polyprenyl-3-methyl-5-hydroxy-6-metoxy-1,4-benzoquinol methylase